MADASCHHDDAFLSYGLPVAPSFGSDIHALLARVRQHRPAWSLGMPGDGTCVLYGSDNVEGRALNGVPDDAVCAQPASHASGEFIHIEQHRDQRKVAAWPAWSGALSDVFSPPLAAHH
jgi:hypothetical protein